MKTNKKQFFSIAQKTLQNVIECLANENFRDDLKKIREEFLDHKNLENQEDKLTNFLSELDKVETMRIKYKLSEPHFNAMAWIVIFNEEPKVIDELLRKDSFKVITNRHGEKIMYIPIYPETTLEDIRETFPSIKEISKTVYGQESYIRFKRKPKLNRDLKALRLKSKGYNNEEIKNFLKDDPDFSKENIIKDDVPKMINKLKKSPTKANKALRHKKS